MCDGVPLENSLRFGDAKARDNESLDDGDAHTARTRGCRTKSFGSVARLASLHNHAASGDLARQRTARLLHS
jgi:hypothetical protein